ncbi:MAG: hypothetical protein ACRDNG_02190 [Gaiellaceae bacterium]
MHELHLLYLAARRVDEETPRATAEVALRAREAGRLQERDRAGPRRERHRPARLVLVRAERVPAR